MPELIEVEAYRTAAEAVVGRRISGVEVHDGYVRGLDPNRLGDVLTGAEVGGARRHGKVLLLDVVLGAGTGETGDSFVLGLRFGMTGRLVVDEVAAIERLEYSSTADRPEWDRFVLRFEEGRVRVNDPRRLGWVELDPDLGRLGPDAATVTARQLAVALDGAATPLKARLLDQSRLAGVGNLIADEVLWHARISPHRAAGSLDSAEVAHLAREIRAGIRRLTRRGGSHRGALQPFRARGGACPRCGALLRRSTVGGRTTWWCPAEQR